MLPSRTLSPCTLGGKMTSEDCGFLSLEKRRPWSVKGTDHTSPIQGSRGPLYWLQPLTSSISKWMLYAMCVCPVTSFMSSPVRTSWTAALQAPLSMEFSRQEYWSALPCPPQGDHPDPGIQRLLHLLHWQAVSLGREPPVKPNYLDTRA